MNCRKTVGNFELASVGIIILPPPAVELC